MITQLEHTCEHKNANSNASKDEIHDKKIAKISPTAMDERRLA